MLRDEVVISHWRNFSVGLLFVATTAVLAGQAEWRASIGGVVRLASGPSAIGVTVTLTETTTGSVVTVRSDRLGSYAASPVRPGTYSIQVDAAGFKPFRRTGISVAAGQIIRQDVALRALSGDRLRAPLEAGAPARCVDGIVGAGSTGADCGAASLALTAITPRKASGASPEPVGEVLLGRSLDRPARAGPRGFHATPAKRATNEFHGALYHSLENDLLNARGFFGRKGKSRRNNLGAFVGGPIIKDKTFFSYHYDRLSVRSGPQSGFGNSVPPDAFRRGDFGSLVTPGVIAADALGRPILKGQIFDPASGRLVRGVPVRDPLPNNMVPASHPSRSRVASRVLPFVVRPQRAGVEFNVQGRPAGAQVWSLDAPSHHLRLDHSFTSVFRAGLEFSRTSHPAVRKCGGVDGCRITHDPVGRPHMNADYYGAGIYEDITTHHVRQSFDWIATANLLNRTTIGYDEFHVVGHSLSAGAQWQERLWGSAGNGLLATDAGPPALGFIGNTRYSSMGNELGRNGFLANHLYSISDGLTWIRRRHTVRIGGEFRYHEYPFRGWASNVAGSFNFHRGHTAGFDAAGNNLPFTGDPFASFLLGQVHSTHFQIPDSPTISERFVSWSVMDEIRITPDLTVTVGLRFEYQSAIRERDDNMSTFDPGVPNPGAGGRLGAMIFAGAGPGRTGARTLESPPVDAFGPRIGIAYRVGARNVVRAAYGIYYSRVPHAQFDSVNTLGFRFHPTANDLSNGRRPAYFLDDGFPRSNIVLPPSIDPSIGNNTSPVAVTRDRATLPRVQQWSLTVQRQVTRTTSVDLSYEGNRGSRLIADRRVLGPAANANASEILDLGPSLLASKAGPEAASAGVSMPYRGFARSVAQSLRPFPHMLNIGYMNVPAGNSFYHAFRSKVEKRFSDGAHFQASYAWSKLTGMGAGNVLRFSDGLGRGPQNPTDTHSLERGLGAEDVPHRVLAAFSHELPFFRDRKSGLATKVLGGWALAGVFRLEAGSPINVAMANDLEPFLFNGQKRPDILSNRVRIGRRKGFDALTDAILDRTAFADPGPLRFGSASRTMDFVRGFTHLAEDLSLFKDTWIGQKLKVRFQTQVANAFNRVVFCDPNRNWSAASFGRVFSQCNTPRSVRFGLRLDF